MFVILSFKMLHIHCLWGEKEKEIMGDVEKTLSVNFLRQEISWATGDAQGEFPFILPTALRFLQGAHLFL